MDDTREHSPAANPIPPPARSAGNPIRVLVLDDEEMVRTLARRVLTGAGCTVETVADGRQGLQILLQREFDVMVVDLHMQGMDGVAFLKEALKIWPWLGVVIMSGFLDPEILAQLATMNIHRSVEKPVDLSALLQQVQDEARDKHALISAPEPDAPDRIQNQLSTVLAALNRARELATRDGLTDVFNRRHLEDQLEHAWKLAERYGHKMGVALLDVDHFKQSNDTFGHLAGDQILREFAQVLQRVARSSDIIGRYGGDEFVVILSKIEGNAAGAFGERILRAVRQHVFCESTLKLHVNCSLGIATTQGPDAARDTRQILQQADYALYAAKRAGRNSYAVWSPAMAKPQEAGAKSATAAEQTPAAPTSKGRILVVDDDELICHFVQRVLEPKGYEVAYELTAAAARQRVDENPGCFDVALVDLVLGPEKGLQVLDFLQSKDSYLTKIIITGYASVENAVESLRHGAYDFVQKPLVPTQLLALVERALTYRRLLQENARYQLHLEDMVREKSAALSGALTEVKQSYDFTLEALAAMLDAREHTTGQHSQRARKFTLLLARKLGLPPGELEEIGRGALLHDIGKTGIPDKILLNANALNPEQKQIMERHAEIGYNIISATPFLSKAAEVVLSHHERFDGNGYPRGLRGKEIPLGARIFSVVDAYDAMRSTRSYRKGMKPADALAEIRRHTGTQFDPDVVEAFLRCQPLIESAGEWDAAK